MSREARSKTRGERVKQLAHFDQHELGFHCDKDHKITFVRRAARAVLIGIDGRIAIMHYTTTGSYKLPGGGIDEGEAIEAALRREVQEEAGYKITDIQELGVVEEDRYCVGMHQTSYCFTATTTRFVGTNLTEKEAAQGMELVWVDSIDDAIAAVESNDTTDSDANHIGHEMMKLREVAILRAAQSRLEV